MKRNLYSTVRTDKYLRNAWRIIRQSAIKSTSKETRDKIFSFEPDLERHLKRIKDQLREGRYRFQPAKGVALHRPGKTPRPIITREISDRIVQRSLLDVVQEQDAIRRLVEHPNSFGGIPKRSVRQAIEKTCIAVRNGAKYYLKSDIKEFFANIPRARALSIIYSCMPDPSINDLLNTATIVELKNIRILENKYPGLFPSYEVGVAQGYCLSPLMGNVLLHEFDRVVNSNGTRCIRFIDDFIILATSNKPAWSAFKKGLAILRDLGLTAYHPNINPDKAKGGTTSKRFDFLGCSIAPGFVQPDKCSQKRLLRKIQDMIKSSIRMLAKITKSGEFDYRYSLVTTLNAIHKTVAAWGNHYSFCNKKQILDNMDDEIDRLLAHYIQAYDALKHNVDPSGWRHILGVFLLTDSKYDPIFPLTQSDNQHTELMPTEPDGDLEFI